MAHRRIIRLLFASLAVALVALVAGCGGGNSDPDPKAELTKAFSPDGLGQLKSGNLDIEMTVGVAEGGDPAKEVKLALTGPFQDHTSDLTFKASGQDPSTGQPIDFTGGVTVTGDNAYFEYGGTEYELGAERFAQLKAAQPAASADTPSAASFKEGCETALRQAGATDTAACEKVVPANWLPKLTFDGTEDVDGTEAHHFSGDLDVERFFSDILDVGLQALPAAQRAQIPGDLLKQFTGFIESAGVDVYVGTDDDIPRRGQFAMKVNVLGQEVDLGIDANVNDANEEQTVSAPADAQPIESLRGQLPAPLRGGFDCFLTAKTAADFTACGTQLQQSTGATGASVPTL